jgi:hypothetical protein
MAPTLCTPDEAAALIRPRDAIGFGLGPADPDAFFTALGARDDSEDLTFGGALLLGCYTVLTHPKVSYRSGFFGPAEPVTLAQAAPPDADGMINLSLHMGATYDELVMAGCDPDRLLVIEVNPNLPRTSSLPPQFTDGLMELHQAGKVTNDATSVFNGALSVDLYGLVVADGVTRSRIVLSLPEGWVVSTPRHHTGVVICEYGSADLSGLTVCERASALTEIAHPDFRDGLRSVADTLGRH